ncbi:alpha/beta hydrolase domain-containing protein [Acrasis kona]|uniref:Alpha/beta hydrolase domain-containing protein n=1 Tax=Acrasis kona TaxID=1008807 RepID=A0AAW2YY53_9EUKA
MIPISQIVFRPPVKSYERPDDSVLGDARKYNEFFWLDIKNRKEEGHKICCFLASHSGTSKKRIVLLSHGNAEDLGQNINWMKYLSKHLEVNVLSYDYEGYGHSTGEPSESNAQDDIQTVYSHIIDVHQIEPKNIFLFGRSLGGGPTIYLAKEKNHELFAGIIMQSCFTSAIRTKISNSVCAIIPPFVATDMFENIKQLDHVNTKIPFLIFHGKRDNVVPHQHGIEMTDKLRSRGVEVEFVSFDDAGHNNITSTNLAGMMDRLFAFVCTQRK